MPNPELQSLSPSGEALLTAWMRSLPPVTIREPDAAQLVRYLSGSLPSESVVEVERALVARPAVRLRAMATSRELARLQASSWAEVAAGPPGEIQATWLEVLHERLAAASRAPAAWAQGWARVLDSARQGAAMAQDALGGLSGAIEQLGFARMAAPAAAVRNAPEPAVLQPRAGVELRLVEARVEPDGALRVHGALLPPGGEGEPLDLFLRAGGEEWPLAQALGDTGSVLWTVDGFAEAFHTVPGPLPIHWFGVRAPGVPPARADRSVFWAAAPGPGGRMQPQPLELIGPVRWEDGACRLTVGANLDVQRAYEGWLLLAELRLGPEVRQFLGAQPLRPWTEAGCEVRIPCPGAPNQVLPITSLLRLTLAPPPPP